MQLKVIKHTRNKVGRNIFGAFEKKRKGTIDVLWATKDCMKTKYYIFSKYKQRHDVCFGLFKVETATS